MSSLMDYLNKVEKDVEKWPSWKTKSLKEAFQIPSKRSNTGVFNYIPQKITTLVCLPRL